MVEAGKWRSRRIGEVPKKLLPFELRAPLVRADLMSWGTVGVAVVCLSGLLIWVLQGSPSLNEPLKIVAKSSAFLSIALLSLEFLLATRWSFLERAFEGLDRMYKAHRVIGKLALVFVIVHLSFLLLQAGPSEQALALIVPGLNLPYTLGIISLIALVALLILTVLVALPYQLWHVTHRLMIIPLVLALWHALDAGSDINAYPVLRYWTIAICAVGVISYLYTLLLYRFLGPRTEMSVVGTRSLGDITEVTMNGKDFSFHPGQFIFVGFPRFGGIPEMFPFSVSSGPDDHLVRISAKGLGDFTREKLPLVKAGDRAVVLGPYGKFGERYLGHKKDMVWIAGGIGITPFLSMARHEREHPTGRNILLIWTFREIGDAVYNDELLRESEGNPELRYLPWPTGEKGRLDVGNIIELVGGPEELRKRTYFLCGPPRMMSDMAHQLMKEGVHLRHIVFEDFNLL